MNVGRTAIGRVPERNNIRMLLENGSHDFPLYPNAASVNDADLAKSTLYGLK